MYIVPKSIARLQIHLQVSGMLMKKSCFFIEGLGGGGRIMYIF